MSRRAEPTDGQALLTRLTSTCTSPVPGLLQGPAAAPLKDLESSVFRPADGPDGLHQLEARHHAADLDDYPQAG